MTLNNDNDFNVIFNNCITMLLIENHNSGSVNRTNLVYSRVLDNVSRVMHD